MKKRLWNILRNTVIVLFVVASLQLDVVGPTVQAVTQADIDALQDDADALGEQRAELESQLEALADDKSQALARKNLLDSQIAWLVNAGTNYLASGTLPARLANGHPNIVPYQVFETADGPMILAVGNDAQFRRFCEVAQIEDVARDSRFCTNVARIQHREAVCERVQAALDKE